MLPQWWHRGGASRFVSSLITAEWPRLKPGSRPPPEPWGHDLELTEDGFGLDSLGLMSLATALTQTLHLHESGIEDYLLARRRFGDWCEIAAAGLDRFSGRITFRSSGSLGPAKSITHSLASLQQEIGYFAEIFSKRRRIVAPLPAHHIYGFLFTLLLPATLGISVLDLRGKSLMSLPQRLQPGDLVIGHPFYWTELAELRASLPPDVEGVTSTAPTPRALPLQLRQLGLSKLVEIYGSSETGGVGWRADPDHAYRLLPYWRRGAAAYQLQRDLPDQPSPAIYSLMDHITWHTDRHFEVIGRRDGAVQIAGSNVDLEAVKTVLLQLPCIKAVALRVMAPEDGARLKAFIVPDDTDLREDELRETLRRHIEARLQPAERPISLTFGPSLPRNSLGKEVDWPLSG